MKRNEVEAEELKKALEMKAEDAEKAAQMDMDDNSTSEKDPTVKTMTQRMAELKERK